MYSARVHTFVRSVPVYYAATYGQDWIARWDGWAETGGYLEKRNL